MLYLSSNPLLIKYPDMFLLSYICFPCLDLGVIGGCQFINIVDSVGSRHSNTEAMKSPKRLQIKYQGVEKYKFVISNIEQS